MWLRLFIFTMVLQSLLMAADGDLDTSFGVDGIVITDLGSVADYANSVAIQSDGKIIAAGQNYDSSIHKYDFALVRYDTNGTPDTSFGTDGIVITSLGIGNDKAKSVAIQNDGKIVVVGENNDDFGVVRYNTDGSPDSSFGLDGIVTTPVGANSDYANSVAIQSDGKIVVAGYIYDSSYVFALVRYDTNGTLDTTFGNEGKVITHMGGTYSFARSVAIQNNGKIVLGGNNSDGLALARYNTDGILDATFGDEGKVIGDSGSAQSVTLQNDGKIVAAGTTRFDGSLHFILVRYDTNGTPDTTFGDEGTVITSMVEGYDDIAKSVAIQSNGKIVVAGYSKTPSGLIKSNFSLARYHTDGILDTTFGNEGKVITDLGSQEDHAYSVAIQSDGKIVAAGKKDKDFALVRYQTTIMTLAPIYYLLQ